MAISHQTVVRKNRSLVYILLWSNLQQSLSTWWSNHFVIRETPSCGSSLNYVCLTLFILWFSSTFYRYRALFALFYEHLTLNLYNIYIYIASSLLPGFFALCQLSGSMIRMQKYWDDRGAHQSDHLDLSDTYICHSRWSSVLSRLL